MFTAQQARLKSKYVDILVAASTFNDERWESPLPDLYNHIREYDNVVFILGKDTYCKKQSFCGVYEILTSNHIEGLDVSCIEPLNFSKSLNFQAYQKENLATMKKELIPFVLKILGDDMEDLKNLELPSLFYREGITRGDAYGVSVLNDKNITKRKILFLFDKSFGNIPNNFCKSVIDGMQNIFMAYAAPLYRDFVTNAYFWYTVSERMAKSLNISTEDYMYLDYTTVDEEPCMDQVKEELGATIHKAKFGFHEFELYSFDVSKVKMPDGKPFDNELLTDFDFLIDAFYNIDKEFPSYLDYVNYDINNFSNGYLAIAMHEISTRRRIHESGVEDYELNLEMLRNHKDKNWELEHGRILWRNFDEALFREIAKDTHIYINYLPGDTRYTFTYPSTIAKAKEGLSKEEEEEFEQSMEWL